MYKIECIKLDLRNLELGRNAELPGVLNQLELKLDTPKNNFFTEIFCRHVSINSGDVIHNREIKLALTLWIIL